MEELTGIGIFEKDFSEELLLTFSFPFISKEHENTVKEFIQEADQNKTKLMHSKIGSNYFYLIHNKLDQKEVTNLYMVLFAAEYFPTKYFELLKILNGLYLESLSTTSLMQPYLTVYGTGKLKGNVYDFKKYEKDLVIPKDYFENEKVKKFFFGHDSSNDVVVKLWNAVLMKMKIVIYSENISVLEKLSAILSEFGGHRTWPRTVIQNISFDSDLQMNGLDELKNYIIGTRVIEVDDMYYDIFVDIDSCKVHVKSGKEIVFTNTKIHTNVAELLKKHGEGNGNVLHLMRMVNNENEKILGKLNKLSEQFEGEMSIDDMKEMGMSKDLEGFMINLALAENLVKIE